jgi:hypothetical protein
MGAEPAPEWIVGAIGSVGCSKMGLHVTTEYYGSLLPVEDHQPPMPWTTPTGKNAAAAISSGRMPWAAQNTEVSQAA